MEEQYELSICTDCAIWHANGDTTGIDDPAREAEVRAGRLLGDLHIAVTGDDQYFSWSRCDACGTNLGGDRIDAVAWSIAA